MSSNTWTYLLLLLFFGFLNSVPALRRRKVFLVLFLNLAVYSLIDYTLLPAFFGFALLTYSFALLVRDDKFASSLSCGLAAMVLVALALFICGKTIPNYMLNPNIAVRALVPLGFSYMALQNIAFVADARLHRQRPLPSLPEFLASSMFFANILSGPIADLYQVRQDILANRVTEDDVRDGILRIINGFCKKSLSDIVSMSFIFPTADAAGITSGHLALVPALLFKFYMDFSGYTDMAIGGAKLIGVSLPENFDRPYSSITMADYWNRWHMTLGGWFKKYFFYPLQMLIFRRLKVGDRLQVALVNAVLFLTFVAIGLWHGLSFKFFLWGVFNAAFVLLSNRMARLKTHLPERAGFWFFNMMTMFLIFAGQLLLLSESTDRFLSNLTEVFYSARNSFLEIGVALTIALLLFLQHRLDAAIRSGFFRDGRFYWALILLQLLLSAFFHRGGGTFLYAEF